MTYGRYTFPDGSPLPAPPPGERPLRPQLPVPPYVEIGGVTCILERLDINDLPRWRQEHGLQRVGTAFMGRLGYVTIHWPQTTEEE